MLLDIKRDLVNFKELPCVEKIREGVVYGTRSLSAKILIIALRMNGLSKQEASSELMAYIGKSDTIENDDLDHQIYNWIKWVYSIPNNRFYWSCSDSKQLKLCKYPCELDTRKSDNKKNARSELLISEGEASKDRLTPGAPLTKVKKFYKREEELSQQN